MFASRALGRYVHRIAAPHKHKHMWSSRGLGVLGRPPARLIASAMATFAALCSSSATTSSTITTTMCEPEHADDDKTKRRNLATDARAIFDAALDAADPGQAVRGSLEMLGEPGDGHVRLGAMCYDLKRFKRIVVVGAGKACTRMAEAVEGVLITSLGAREAQRKVSGHIVTKYDHSTNHSLQYVTVSEAGHPVPDEAGVKGASRVAALVAGAAARDTLVIACVSGGGSALLAAPVSGVSLRDLQVTNEALLACGAPIEAMNAVRKHLGLLKGGRLAKLAAPSHVVALVLSDVVGDPLDVIASGPTVGDSSTLQDCAALLEQYPQLEASLPKSVLTRLLPPGGSAALAASEQEQQQQQRLLLETPKPGDPCFDRVTVELVGSNALAVAAAEQKARELGYATCVLTTTMQGEAKEAGRVLAAIGVEARRTGRPVKPPCCIIAGGETTVQLGSGPVGKGGRNQELAVSAARDLQGVAGVCLFAGGTDGTDGPTDAAGGVVDGNTISRASRAGMDVAKTLKEHSSYAYLAAAGGLVKTGPTGTNVADVTVVLVE